MTEFPTLCVLNYDRDGAEQQRSTAVGLRLPRPRKPRPRSRTHPPRELERDGAAAEARDREGLEFLARGVQGSGEYGAKTQLNTTPYRYGSSKSSSLQASRDDNQLNPKHSHSSYTTPELPQCIHNGHHRSLSEPPPRASERAHTAPTSAFSLPVLRQGGAGDTSLTVNAELLQDPKWNEYLSAWVSGAQVGSHAFVSFVGAMSLKDRGRYHYMRQFEELPALPCPRFFEHMHRIPAPKSLWKDKKKDLKKPEFWTWKGRTSPKIPKPRPVRKRVQVCNSLQAVQITPPSTVQCLTVDIPTCSQDSEGSLATTPTSDLCTLSDPTSSVGAPSPVRTPEEEKTVRWQVEKPPEQLALPEIEEYSEPSDYGSIRSGMSSPVSVGSQHTVTSVPLKLHKLENPPRPPTAVDWDKHSYLAGFDDNDSESEEEGDDADRNHGNENAEGAPNVNQKDVTMGPLETSKVDQSSYMYNDHIAALEPVVYESYLPLDDPLEMMRSLTVPGCQQSVVEPYPLEEPLQPDVAGLDRNVIQRSSILTRPELPSPPPPPPPKEPTPPPTPPPPPKEPTPPPKTPTPPPIEKPKKKPSKPKRPPKKEKVKVVKAVKAPVKQPTPTPKPQPMIAPPTSPTPPPPPEPEPVKIPTPEPPKPQKVIELPPLPPVADPEPEVASEVNESVNSNSPEPDDLADEPSEASPATSPTPGTPPPPPLPSSPAERDMSFAQELERQRLAEERHRKAMLMYDKLRAKQPIPTARMEEADNMKEYGWLAQFCILKPEKLRMYHMAFDTVDENHKGWLSCFDTLIALKGITGTQNLTEKEEEYICRILEIADYNILEGSDFRIFSVMAGLSQKLASIDAWVRNLIQKIDLQTLDWKMYRGKELFEWCMDESTNRLSVSRLLIELRAGGVSDLHLDEVRDKFGEDGTLDLIDFLTYLPLFIMTHKSVVCNPLCDVRDK
ncbi:titin-like isoform X4 [Patiria miniata]|uniref:Uncharacterized protein n=1 Tax=Patiria miniata TaxID=46514 RepID=A0A913ZBG0_PATMI|nr:titin-like isoform X4 [Patiria miniata]